MKYLTFLTIIYIPIYLIYYIIKRIIFTIIYPIAYILRKQINKKVRSEYDYFIDWERHRHIKFNTKIKKLWLFLWFALDDAPYFLNNYKEYFDKYIPKYYKTEFLKSFYWGALRNNAVNLSRYIAIYNYKEIFVKIGNINKIEIKHFGCFPYFLPFIEFYTGKLRWKAGWLKNGKFEIGIRKSK